MTARTGLEIMAHPEAICLAQQIDSLFDGGSLSGLTDAQLLERFNARRDARGEAAFAEIVSRHGSMVLAVCHQFLDDRHHAEDAFQATFLVLARKARSLTRSDWLGNWLYAVAVRTAQCARGRLARRRKHEEVGAMTQHGADHTEPGAPSADEAIMARDQARVLHGEIARLPETFRLPVVLCYLEGLTVHEAARRLQWSHGTVRSRMARAREKLRQGLARRGVIVPAALLAATLEARSARASVSSSLSSLTTRGAIGFAVEPIAGGSVSISAAALARDVLRTMTIHRLVTATVAIVLLGAVAGGAGVLIGALPSRAESSRPARNTPPPVARTKAARGVAPTGVVLQRASRPAEAPGASAPASNAPVLRILVLDPEGKPLPNANVKSSIWTTEKDFKHNRDYRTDASGFAAVALPKTYMIVRIWVSKAPFVSMFTHWEEDELAAGVKVPAEYTIALERAVSAGGRVVDEDGRPVAGATVQVKIENDVHPAKRDPRISYDGWLANREDAVTTDADGRWHIDNVPNDPTVELSLLVTHPDHGSDGYWGDLQRESAITAAMLRNRSATLKLKAGTIVRGRVTDDAGKPIAGAIVVRGDDPYFSYNPTSEFVTDADGRFRLPAQPPGKMALTVIAPGWAPQDRVVDVRPGLAQQDFRMERGKPIMLRFVDAAGQPVQGASVRISRWHGRQALHNHDHPNVRDTKVPRSSDTNGIWSWTWAPEAPVTFQIYAKGFAGQTVELSGGGPERTIELKAEHRVTGRVTDAVTGRPIEAFSIVPVDVFRKDWFVAEPQNAKPGKDGRLEYLATRSDIPIRLRIEALGYRVQDGPAFRLGDDSARTQDFRLQPSPPITGLIVDTAGRPLPNVKVELATPTQDVSLWSEGSNRAAQTDSAGRFTFPDPGVPWGILARSDAGFVFAEFPADRHDVGRLTLRPYVTIRGQFRDGGKPVQGAQILLQIVRGAGWTAPKFDNTAGARVTGPDGRFEFTRVPAVPLSLWVRIGPWEESSFRSGPHVPLDPEPGQTVDLDLGSGGAVVTGKVTLTGNVPSDLDCNYSLNYLVERAPGITPPPAIAKLGFDVRNGWRDSWSSSPDGDAYRSTLRNWFVKLAPDGSFRISGVPAGEYDLSIRVYARPNGCLVDPLARVITHVTVTPEDAGRGRLEVPEIRAQVVPIPAVGDRLALRFQRDDGREGTAADFAGALTVVHFWASWCGPCKEQMPALRRVHERFTERGVIMLGLSVDEDDEAWREAAQRLALSWPQGRLSSPAETGVSSVPAYWLVDRDGKIVDKVNDVDDLAECLNKRLK